ncbi:hypothetical protein [Actinoplanes awajinensis]|uniref:Uncharacterized protein n=1 Tax=Actinoplanes awajinensis subsp. mycoplanecinus TaxID=135947 RepID=A0A0X3UV50_9ACTN|nr:hypothetical protein [Actinoplanes awajinensis]KUL34935.1 hypothetical protein ADL15_15065 [Actinoplanes awajinensis subsp. mycoplanecinus]KUL36451.1 hypothetical protein ADL15_13180 [Actinoplanes awajinensis subsp. mycoplanecinus]
MTVSAVVIGINDGPVTVKSLEFDPDEVYLGFAGGLCFYVREADIDRLSAALEQAREVLRRNASNQIDQGVK